MRRTFGIALAAAVFALTLGCGKKDTTTSGGSAKGTGIEGGWTLVALEVGGLPAEVKGAPKRQATSEKITWTEGGKEQSLAYKLDPSKTPHEVELTATKDGKAEVLYGIYKLEGDTLTICASQTGKPEDRPKEFVTKDKGLSVMMMTLKKD